MKKLRKKILPVLLLLFTISNIGIPLSIHFCKSMQIVSLKSCSACGNHLDKNLVSFSKVKNCCENRLAAKPIKDEYLSVKVNLKEVKISDIISFVFPGNYDSFNFVHLNTEFKENSPPGNFASPNYITNLQFLV